MGTNTVDYGIYIFKINISIPTYDHTFKMLLFPIPLTLLIPMPFVPTKYTYSPDNVQKCFQSGHTASLGFLHNSSLTSISEF